MTDFTFTSPEGKQYKVTGPDGSTKEEAFQRLQRKLQGMPDMPADAPPPATPQQPPMSAGEQAADVAKSAAIGPVKGGIGMLGSFGDVGSIGRELAYKGLGFLGAKPEEIQRMRDFYSRRGGELGTGGSADIQKKVEGLTGDLYQPKTAAGRYTESVTGMLPAAAGGPGGLARRVVGQAVIPGIASEAAGEAAQKIAPGLEPYARGAAAIAAPMAGGRLITPVRAANPARQAAVTTLRNEGVTDITAGQATGNRRLRYAESELGGSTAEHMMERQGEQFTSAALRRVGEQAERATPEVIDRAFTRIGGQMDRLAAANPLVADRTMWNDLQTALSEYRNLVAEPMRAPIVQHIVDRLVRSMSQQQIGRGVQHVVPGRVYAALRSDIGRYARGAARDPQLQHALYEIQGALDANVERVIGRQNPNMLGQWQQARRQYRNMLVIERAANYAGETATSGIITPANLARATKSLQGMRNYARGRGDFTPLARAGVEVMSPLPSSGTAQRLRAHAIPAAISAAIGGTAGSAAGPLGTAAGAAAGVAVPRLAGEAMLSRPGRAWLSNQRLTGDPHAMRSAAVRGGLAALQSDARDALKDKDRKLTTQQRQDLRAVSRGTASIDQRMRANDLLAPAYGGVQ